jgi:tRNA A-37 threonylcarbamoyl transferase component Bud32/cell division protein FtsN
MQQIGRYQILEELGRGAMGVVYRALDPAIGRPVAIKTIRLRDISDESERERLRERLFREAQSAGSLSHPGIVTVYDIGEQQEVTYIAMEYVKGQTLEALMSGETPLAPARILDILRQTAAALDYAHKKGIVHRDIKPANIMVSEDDGAAKITDFGVAKLAASGQMTHAGTVVGTPNYMAPEQVEGRTVDGRTDQFALAVIAYEILTGEKPFAGEQLTSVLYRIVSEEPPAPHALNPALPWAASVVLGRAMSKDPAKRYPTATEFVSALEAALNSRKDWKALPRGASEAMPTAIAPRLAAVTSTAPRPAAVTSPREEATIEDTEPVRRGGGLFWKTAGAMLAGVAVVAAFFIFADRWLSEDVGLTEPVDEQPLAETAPRPAPMPPPVVVAPSEQAQHLTSRTMPAQLPPDETATSEAASPGTGQQSGAAGQTAPATATVPVQQTAEARPQPPAAQVEPRPEEPKPAPVEPPARRVQAQAPEPARTPARTAAQAAPAARPPRPAPAAEPERYTLQVVTSPPGASIIIDNNPARRCTSPCSVELEAGRHTISATLEGHRKELRIVELTRPDELFIGMFRPTGTVRVETTPPGAQVFIDGKAQRQTTPATFVLPAGTHRFAVVLNGRTTEQDVVVREGGLYQLSLNP